MKKYIDKEAAKNAINSEISQHYKDVGDSLYERGYHNGLTMAYSILLDVPAADVVEKRYGEWGKPMHTEHGWIRKCSSCLYSWDVYRA